MCQVCVICELLSLFLYVEEAINHTVIIISMHIYNQFLKDFISQGKLKHSILTCIYTYRYNLHKILFHHIKMQISIFNLADLHIDICIHQPKYSCQKMLLFTFSQRSCILSHAIFQVFHKKKSQDKSISIKIILCYISVVAKFLLCF